MQNILIRCDASKEIGLGHVNRCLVLAKRLRHLGYSVIFAMKSYELGLDKINKEDFLTDIAPKEFDYSVWIDACVEKYKIDTFIGDIRDGLPLELIKELKSKNIFTIAIDEPSDYAKECDLCFYPPHASIDKTLYKGKVFKGFEYVILKDEFYEEFLKLKNEIPTVLVMMGGTDSKNLSLEVLKNLDKNEEQFNIKVIINKQSSQSNLIEEFKIKASKKIEIFDYVENLSEFLNIIDFAIISFGVSAYEMIYKKVPSIHICLDTDHEKASQVFQKEGYAVTYTKKDIKLLEKYKFSFDKKIELKVVKNKIVRRILDETV